MSLTSVCRQCGRPMVGTVRGFCPHCLVELGIALSSESAPQSPPTGQSESRSLLTPPERPFAPPLRLGDYELLEEIGRGGMGVVYRARQRSLDRIVAVKMMSPGPGNNPDLVKRFRAEATSAARLRHPNIVAIHEVGVQENQRFFVMDYIPGASLAKHVGSQPLPAPIAARYVRTVAEAVHYAHEQGILHRDLKPSNILIDARDQPMVVDFGLARPLGGASELTVSGQVLGSPNYLPPEQVAGHKARVSRETDVYALGATLYHLLTGRPPFQAETIPQTISLVLHMDPVAPRLLNPSVPRDLETICLKCLEKEPPRRYASALDLAQELRRFQTLEPIHARPLGPAGRVRRWCERKPQMACLAAVAIIAVMIGAGGVLWQLHQTETQRLRAEKGEQTLRRALYAVHMRMAQQELAASRFGAARALLEKERLSRGSGQDLRGWEWRYLWQQSRDDADLVIDAFPNAVRDLAVSSDNRLLAASSEFGGVKVWDLSNFELYDLVPERNIQAFIAFSPDAQVLRYTDQSLDALGSIGLWDTRKRLVQAPWTVPGQCIGPLLYSGDGHWFAYGFIVVTNIGTTGSEGMAVCDRTAAHQQPAFEIRTQTIRAGGMIHPGFACDFAPDGTHWVGSETDGRILWGTVPNGTAREWVQTHTNGVTALALSQDGSILATGAGYSETAIKIWSFPAMHLLATLTNHQAWIADLRFSPDGSTLASSSADSTIRLWDARTWQEGRILHGHRSLVSRICFWAGGTRLFSGGQDGRILSRPLTQATERPCADALPTNLRCVAVSPDATQYAGLSQNRVYLAKMSATSERRHISELGTNNTALLFCRDGQRLFTGTGSGQIQVWSLAHERLERTLHGPIEKVDVLQQDIRGRYLGAVLQTPQWKTHGYQQLWIWDTLSWQLEATHTNGRMQAVFALSPQGALVARGHAPGVVELHRLSGSQPIQRLKLVGRISDLEFTPNGESLLASTLEGQVGVWNMADLSQRHVFQAHSHSLSAIVFSPNGDRLATCGQGDQALRIWDTETWELLVTIKKGEASLCKPSFTLDGNAIVTVHAAAENDEVLIWRAPTLPAIDAEARSLRRH